MPLVRTIDERFQVKLMATKVLDAGAQQPGLHLYAHCRRGTPGGVTLLALNLKPSAEALQVSGPAQLYTLTNPDLQSRTALLNGKPLAVGAGDTLPAMAPRAVKSKRVTLVPTSINFITLPGRPTRIANGEGPVSSRTRSRESKADG